MSNQNESQNSDEATTHLRVLVQALQVAARRGAFELEEAGNINESIKFFNNENKERDEELQREHLKKIIGFCEVAQKRGAYNLAESYTVYPHVQFFLQEPEQSLDNNSDNNSDNNNEDNFCGKDTCDPDKCPCPPDDCPCDADNNCNTSNECCKPNIEQVIEKAVPSVTKETKWNAGDY